MAKRYTDYPQVFLALAFNSGVLVSMSNFLEETESYFPSIGLLEYAPLYIAGVIWTIIYDTVYGHQDKKDDKKIGVRSLALLWGSSTIKNCLDFQKLMFSILVFHGLYYEFSFMYFPTLALVYYYCAQILKNVKISKPESCYKYFQKMRIVGLLLMVTFALGNQTTLKEYFKEEKQKMKQILNN